MTKAEGEVELHDPQPIQKVKIFDDLPCLLEEEINKWLQIEKPTILNVLQTADQTTLIVTIFYIK